MRSEDRRSLVLAVFAAAAFASASASGCTSAPPAPVAVDVTADTRCSKRASFTQERVFGSSLPPHTLALTFDDGPSERTLELGAYLAAEGIEAGFFVNGMRVVEHPNVAPQLASQGHLIGNHTQEHLDLTDLAVFPPTPQGDDALVASVAMTDTLVAPYFEAGRRLFRAPFGAWNARAFAVLEASPMHVYVGPIDWDIGDHRSATTGADWACWQNAPALATKACGDLFLMQITAVDRGIVLMHDAAYGNEANHALTAGVGNTVDMVKYLVPRLKAAGYAFVRVDHVPAIDAQLPPLPPAAPPSGPSNDAGTDHPPLDADAGPAATPTPTAAPPPTPDPCAAPETTRSAVAR